VEWKEKEEIRALVFIVVHLLGSTTMNDYFPKHDSPLGPVLMGIFPKCTTFCQAPEHSYVYRSILVTHLQEHLAASMPGYSIFVICQTGSSWMVRSTGHGGGYVEPTILADVGGFGLGSIEV